MSSSSSPNKEMCGWTDDSYTQTFINLYYKQTVNNSRQWINELWLSLETVGRKVTKLE